MARTLLLAILTNGLYWFHWQYRVRKQMEEHTGRPQHPVFYAVSQAIPFWNLVCFYESAQAYNRLCRNRGIRGTVRITAATILIILNTAGYITTLAIAVTIILALSAITSHLSDPGLLLGLAIDAASLTGAGSGIVQLNQAMSEFLGNPFLTAFLAASIITQAWASIQMLLLCWVQSGINEYWEETYGEEAGRAGLTTGEMVTVLAGLLTWLAILSAWTRT